MNITHKEMDIISNFTIPNENGNRVDYKNLICSKPWGYEFLAYESNKLAIWCLTVRKGNSTSLHCHFKKDTLIIVLEGCARVEMIDQVHVLGVLESMYIPLKKFHAIGTFSPETVILEVEIFRDSTVCFSDKNDLLRIDDQYKRKNVGYESSINLSPADHRSFWLEETFDSVIHDVKIKVQSLKNISKKSKYDIVIKGEYYDNGYFLKEGTVIQNIPDIKDDCLVLSLDKIDWFEDCKIIYDIEQLSILCKNKKIAMTSGCFDIVHVGHIHNLKMARQNADYLFVCLSNDEQIKKLKGDKRPINTYEDRINLFKTIKYVDYIILYEESNIQTEESLGKLIKTVDPYCWVKGDDYTKSQIIEKHPYIKKVVLVPNTPLKSTTSIIDRCR